MKIKILLSMVIGAALIKTANAQSADHPASVQHRPIADPLAVVNQLLPVAFEPATPNAPCKAFGFDLAGAAHLPPGLTRTETLWIPKGKNYQSTAKRTTIDYEQLVPLLVAALQKQQSELTALKSKLEHVQKTNSPVTEQLQKQ
ncbi:hypothetical protein ABIC45_002910 [Mucilaginibacter rubeus]|uniref:hypothetical protein n=1 Tax=Mucilaginibacter rubeus TaxID=2027860 RepID=UPI003392C055